LKRVTVAFIAEKIETQEEYARACDEGFTLIQGYYFCRPQLVQNRKVPANRLSHIEILRMLSEDPVDLSKLTLLVKRDTSLTYRLLRLVNSPLSAMRQEVRSVEAAMLAVGEDGFRRIAALAITSELNAGQSIELLRMAIIRGRFCELVARMCDLDPTEQYLLGLLSLLPAMMRIPMEELTPFLPLRDEICLALMGAGIPERRTLEWLMSHEQGDWTACDQIADAYQLDQITLLQCYSDAVVWAEAAFHLA
jgi:EAL and modified HD-GYP domain-containing signal transduction protein